MSEQGQLIPVRPGEALRQQRSARGLSITFVAQQLRIRGSILQSIEDGHTDSIAPVYLRGFLKAYADFLDVELEEEGLSTDWQRMRDSELRSIHSAAASQWSTDRWLKATSYIVASVLIAALAWQFANQAVRISQGESSVQAGDERPTVTVADDSAISGAPATPVAEAKSNHINASIASMELLQKSRRNAGEDAWAALSAPAPSDTPIPEGHQRILLSASADSWVEILDAPGQYLEMDLIRGGSSREYVGQPPFRILIGRASAVELILEEQPIDLAPHTRGNVARLTLQAELVADAGEPSEPQH